MFDKLVTIIKKEFSQFAVTSEKNDDKQTATITARNGWCKGFEIEVYTENNRLIITHSSKMKTVSYVIVFGLTAALTHFFGHTMLQAMGLIADTGSATVTLKIFYIIPVFIFLIPLFIISTLIMKYVSPPDNELLLQVQSSLTEYGFKSQISI